MLFKGDLIDMSKVRKPRKIWKKDFAHTDWTAVEIEDWIEGAGVIESIWTRDLVRNIGAVLMRYAHTPEGEVKCPACGAIVVD